MAHKRNRGNGQGSLFRRQPNGPWIGTWYDHNHQRRERSTRTTDKRAAERLLQHWTTGATLRREGVVDAGAERLAEQTRRPIQDHLAEFETALAAKGGTARHVELVVTRARRVMQGCKIATWTDVSGSAVMEYLSGLREDRERPAAGGQTEVKRGISAQTFNFYLQAVKQFCRWMVRDRRAADNPLAHLQGLNVKVDRRHDRRALLPDELRRLLDAAQAGPERFGMCGADRALVYRLAVETGLRSGELRSLTRDSFDLAGSPPTVTVKAAYHKRRRDASLPVRSALVALLRDHLAGKAPAALAFNMPDRRRGAAMIREDLSDAGMAARDGAGRVLDFHCLRHTFITNLAAGGVHPKTAQSLARHSTITLTMDRYTHQYAGGELAALAVLPDLDDRPSAKAVRATGTYDAPPAGFGAPSSSPSSSGAMRGMFSASRRDGNASRERVSDGHANTELGQKQRENASSRDAAQDDANGGGGIRTHGAARPHAGFQDRSIQPLWHPTRPSALYESISAVPVVGRAALRPGNPVTRHP